MYCLSSLKQNSGGLLGLHQSDEMIFWWPSGLIPLEEWVPKAALKQEMLKEAFWEENKAFWAVNAAAANPRASLWVFKKISLWEYCLYLSRVRFTGALCRCEQPWQPPCRAAVVGSSCPAGCAPGTQLPLAMLCQCCQRWVLAVCGLFVSHKRSRTGC